VQLSPPKFYLGETLGALLVDLDECICALLNNLGSPLRALLLRILKHATSLVQHSLHCTLQ
jgi:hypothetical protein